MQDAPQLPDIRVEDIDLAANATVSTADDTVVTLHDMKKAFSRVTEENAQLKQELDEAKRKARTSEILDSLIEPYAKKAFFFMSAYSGIIGIMVFMNAFGCFRRPISDSVLQILVGSTAVTVVGLVGMVLTGIFIGARK